MLSDNTCKKRQEQMFYEQKMLTLIKYNKMVSVAC